MNKLSTKLRQKQSIVPQQIIKSRLLELSIDELEKDLENEIQVNPVIEEKSIEESRSNNQVDSFQDQSSYELFLANIPESKDITDDLITQIDTSNLDEISKLIGKEIVFNLDKNGFLDIELELIADNHNVDVEEIEQIRKEVMELNPVGVGSKDLKEYLTFQIGDSNSLSNKIVENHFDDFLNQDKDKIKQNINCSDKEIDEAFSFISDQNFSPILDNDLGIENVLPDAIVKEKEDKWLILINDRLLNKYQISQDYLDAAMNSNSSKEEKTFLKNHISDAQNILDTLNYRSNTLKDVIEQILLVQGNFLSNKSEFLNPLKLEDIANKIDKDISSISRVVKNKYIDTPIGLISLKSLFSNALTKKSGKTASTNELKKVMLEIIDAEDKKSPLSDSDIVEKLNEKDFLIARRTVAKYRKLLDIKNVNQRIEK
ncbi:RNA polymerase factor sigma-54 [Candidatus Marinimicrobia bacterium]|nr:RNA polymerase factor sigma-54 [Candidatus Neomarinimicrobiota bacterium]MDA9735771.1 RNA polymerase factor sigma-54 [Candidatus Neomarinimicrobiota bacterium]